MAQVSIQAVRREIMRAGSSGQLEGINSTAAVGTLFHSVVSALMGPQGWQTALEPEDLEDSRRLVSYTYDNLLGPRITESQAGLSEYGAEALALWEATQAYCSWVLDLLRLAYRQRSLQYDRQTSTWIGAENLCRPEFPLQWEVREPHWTAPVLVSGVADAIWQNPNGGRWCVVEYKLGKGNPEADLGQACLYQTMLAASDPASTDGAMALLSFRPELEEYFFSSAELASAQANLRALIGRLAGVLPQPATSINLPNTTSQVKSDTEHTDLGKRLVRALKAYNLEVDWKGEVTVGPAFLRYHLLPGRSVKVKSIKNHFAELQMQLNLDEAPFIDLAGGRLVIDVQRPDRQTVDFESLLEQIPRRNPKGDSQVPLGIDLNGKLQFVDLASPNNPHLLVAGTSGSGKSEWLRMALAGVMMANTPESLRLVLIDPKRNAFMELKDSPFLLNPNSLVFPPEHSVIDIVDLLIEKMEERYKKFSRSASSDIDEYRAKTGETMPRIVCVCDEYADILTDSATKKNLENAIHRLGAKARAAGIHLIIATQYPDSKTVGGALKMNLAGRVCLRTTNHIQSNMIINRSGAERLLGKGDLFFLSIGEPARLQAPYLSSTARSKIFGQSEGRRINSHAF